MPLQYKIEYHWPDKPTDFALKERTKTRRSGSINVLGVRSPGLPSGTAASEKAAGGGSGGKQGIAGKGADSGAVAGKERGKSGAVAGKERGKNSAAVKLGVEKVLLPAGYCIYYAKGRGAPLLQFDPHQGRLIRSSNKGLGVVNPDSHHVAEEEYAIIREVMEMYLEKQVSQGVQGDRYRAGGQLQQQKQLVDQLLLSLPPDPTEGPLLQTARPDLEAGSLDHSGTDHTAPDPPAKPSDTARSLPLTARATGRCLLPISRALRAHNTPRGPFLMAGQAVLDTGADSGAASSRAPEVGEEEKMRHEGGPPELRTMRLSGVSVIPSHPPQDHSHSASLVVAENGREKAEGASAHQFWSLASHSTAARQKSHRPAVNQGPVHALSHHQQQGLHLQASDGGPKKSRKFLKNRGQRRFVPAPARDTLLLVSEKSPLEHRPKDMLSTQAAHSPPHKASHGGTQEVFSGEKPIVVSSVFRGSVKGKAIEGPAVFQQWKPQASSSLVQRKKGEEGREGHSSVTRVSSRLVLDVVLPREVKSREDLTLLSHPLLGRPLYRTQQYLQDCGLSSPSSPPPPPPPSAPTNDTDDLGDMYFLHQYDDGEDADDDDVDDSGSLCSTLSSNPAAGPLDVDAAQEPDPDSWKVNRTSSHLLRIYRPSPDDTGCAPATTPAPEPADSRHHLPSQHSPPQTVAHSSHMTTAFPGHIASSQQPLAPGTLAAAMSRSEVTPPEQGSEDVAGPGRWSASRASSSSSSCPRGVRCSVLGPQTCADCQATLHRRHFTAQQDLLYPQIAPTPRHMLASSPSLKGRTRGGHTEDLPALGPPTAAGFSAPAAYVTSAGGGSQLSGMVTDLELCRRIVEKGHRARLPSSFS